MMVGEKIDLHIERTAPKDPQERLRVEHLTVRNKEGAHVLEDVNFTANGGEILGIAGISGCGQKELLEAIAGLQASEKGSSIVYKPADGQAVNLVGKSPRPFAVWVSLCPLCRRTDWVWAWWAIWILWTT